MVNATEDITIFNLRYDSETRREVLVPTTISGVSLYHSVGVAGTDKRSESITYKIRIPITTEIQDNREYISESEYENLDDDTVAGYWTLQKGCYILIGIVSDEIADIQALREYDGEFITVVEYADNTRRGSNAVKHWRIGGA